MREKIIGRIEEQRVLQKLLTSKKPEFLAIYGRRRIGKTYLIKRFYSNKACSYFQVTGIKDGSMKEQLYEFTRSIEKTFYQPGITLKEPETWMKALEVLTSGITQYNSKKRLYYSLMRFRGLLQRGQDSLKLWTIFGIVSGMTIIKFV